MPLSDNKAVIINKMTCLMVSIPNVLILNG